MSSAGGVVAGGFSFAPPAGSVNTFTSGVVGGGGPAAGGFALRQSDGADPGKVMALPLCTRRCCLDGGMEADETTSTAEPAFADAATRLLPLFFSVTNPPVPTAHS